MYLLEGLSLDVWSYEDVVHVPLAALDQTQSVDLMSGKTSDLTHILSTVNYMLSLTSQFPILSQILTCHSA